ncbi:YciI family protein [Rhizobium pisi]|uniref:YciI family protein n=1 Tax=Rhizobium pisi TaxID=574561 RepID=UPI00315C99FC
MADHLDSHRAWLIGHTKAGRIIASGPMNPATGGIVLASCADKGEPDAMLHADSVYDKLVDRDTGVQSRLRADLFPVRWAPEAKGVPVASE